MVALLASPRDLGLSSSALAAPSDAQIPLFSSSKPLETSKRHKFRLSQVLHRGAGRNFGQLDIEPGQVDMADRILEASSKWEMVAPGGAVGAKMEASEMQVPDAKDPVGS